MSADYLNEYQAYMASGALASPARTPERTSPDASRPKTSSRSQSGRDFSAPSPTLPSFDDSSDSRGDNAYTVDTNRFTSNLQASFVSEILNLRRELDSKHNFIDGLEESLKNAQTENELLSQKLRESNRNTRQTENRFRNLENSSFDAVEGLLHERDDLKKTNQELRSRLETQSRKTKKLDEENNQIKESWTKEREAWGIERRQMDQKIHIAETRLRNLVSEIHEQQAALENHHHHDDDNDDDNDDEDDDDDTFDTQMDSPRDSTMQRPTGNTSDRIRRSVSLSVASTKTMQRPSMTSLADELNSEDDEDYDSDEDDLPLFSDIRTSIVSRSSATSVRKARKILGLTADGSSEVALKTPPADAVRPSSLAARFGFSRNKGGLKSGDTSRASSRDPSPAARDRKPDETPDESSIETTVGHAKRLTYTRLSNVSLSKKYNEPPISPPETPQIGVSEETSTRSSPAYHSAMTQTADLATPSIAISGDLPLRRKISVTPVEVSQVPFITVQAPRSPAIGRTVLPPGTRSVSVQTDKVILQDVGIQTEVRIDRRTLDLPSHLLPSALDTLRQQEESPGRQSMSSSRTKVPLHRSTFSKDGHRFPLKPIDLPPPRLLAAPAVEPMTDSEVEEKSNTRHLHWHTDSTGSDDVQLESDVDTNAMFGNIPALARPNVRNFFDGPPRTVPENRAISPAIHQSHFDRWASMVNRPRNDSAGSSGTSRPSSSKRGAGPFSGSHERSGRPDSRGTNSSVTKPPPFPIPFRSSSRPQSHAGTEEPRSPTFRDAKSVRSRRSSHETRIAPGGGLRKVQSSGSMRKSRPEKGRRRRAPNLEPIQSMAIDAAMLDAQFSLTSTPIQNGHRDLLNVDSPEAAEESGVEEEEEVTQDNVVVDAIAATMVGEWMWKYVRRRKSFGFGDSRADQVDDSAGSSGVRHKRWVWLSPYERTVMWSTKQPNSGPALLGKAGRKLTIKSVLDVKDPNPLHKGAVHEPVFDRSILILTPERALRFTAPNKERHYLWLTALSFLAQSGRGPPMIPRMQSPIPEPEPGPTAHRRTSLLPAQVAQAYPRKKDDEFTFKPPQRVDTFDSVAPPSIMRLPIVNSSRLSHRRQRSSTNPQFVDGGVHMQNDMAPALPAQAYGRRSSNLARPPSSHLTPARTQSDRGDLMKTMDTVCMDAFIGRGSRKDHGSTTPPAIPSRNRLRTPGSSSTISTRRKHEAGNDPFDNF